MITVSATTNKKLQPATSKLNQQVKTVNEAVVDLVKGKRSESFSSGEVFTSGKFHPMNSFLYAIHEAFDKHYSLILSPDAVWLCIAQGFASHILLDPEKYRHFFVTHQGKETLEVRRDSFVKGQNNDWMNVFSEFSEHIADRIGSFRNMLVADFSTTGPVEKAVSEIVLMKSMSAYFDYLCKTCCGIPTISLTGTVEDWQKIKDKLALFRPFDLDQWLDALEPVLDKIIAAMQGEQDPKFWENLYHLGGGSGGPYVNGWINVLFPYLTGYKGKVYFNKNMNWQKSASMFGGASLSDFPIGLSQVPFIWEYYSERFEMEFVGGFVGIKQYDNLSLEPVIGWAVRESGEAEKSEEKPKEWEDLTENKTVVQDIRIIPADETRKLKLGWDIEENLEKTVHN